MVKNKWFKNSMISMLAGFLLAIFFNKPWLLEGARASSDCFLLLMKMISTPIIFFALFVSVLQVFDLPYKQILVKTVLTYVVGTTFLACVLTMLFCQWVGSPMLVDGAADVVSQSPWSLRSFVHNLVPKSIVDLLGTGNVLTCVIFAVLLAFCTSMLPEKERFGIQSGAKAMNALFLEVANFCVKKMPLFLWAFVFLFVGDLTHDKAAFVQVQAFLILLTSVFFVHAFLLLPLLVYLRTGANPLVIFRASLPSLSLAFWTQSSSITVPTSIEIVTKSFGLKKKEAQFLAPMCAAMNMNGSAITIYTTVYSVMVSAGVHPTWPMCILGIVLVALASMGNAGVPMGAYFMSTALLSSIGVPVKMLGVIFPVMVLVDKLETTVNIWVDLCIMRTIAVKLEESLKGERRS